MSLTNLERNPEAFRLSHKHIRVLENMLNWRLAKAASLPKEVPGKRSGDLSYILAEIASLNVAIAELREVLSHREL